LKAIEDAEKLEKEQADAKLKQKKDEEKARI
jgi:hypothetical protein